MSVDTSISIGVGFLVDPEAFEAYKKRVDPEGTKWEDDYFEYLLSGMTGLCYGTGGSYYTDHEPLRHWIGVSRLTSSYGTDEIPGGVITHDKPVVTLDERNRLNAVAKELGQPEPELTQFLSVLWH